MRPSKLFLLSLLALAVYSCAPVRPQIPVYHGSVQDFIGAARKNFDSMAGTLSVRFEKRDGRKMSADAVARITPEGTSVRFYHMGMLVGDLDTLAGRSARYGAYEGLLKKALMWWRISGYKAESLPGEVLLATKSRILILDARTYVPLRQTIVLQGSEAVVTYSDYRSVGEGPVFWYPFKISAVYRGDSLEISVSKVSLTHS